MKEYKEYKFKWNDNKACRDRGCFGSEDTTEELIFLANNLSLQKLRRYLHNIDISGGAAFIYWIVDAKTGESVFESGYEEDDYDWC